MSQQESSLDPKSRRQLRLLLPIAATFIILAYAWPSLRLVNITWDEALGDLFFGQRYFSFFTSFDPIYLDFESDPYPEGHRPDLRAAPFRIRPWEYYPFANTLAAGTSALFSGQLGLIDPLDGFHLLNLGLVVLLVPWLFFFVERRLGLVAAFMTIALLFGSPRLIAHLLANIKDFPLMVFFTITSLIFFRAFEEASVGKMVLAGACLGLTLATKANALFFPLLPLFLLALAGLPRGWTWPRLALAGSGAAGVTIGVTLAVWPYLWADPIGRFGQHFSYIATRKDAIAPQFELSALEAILLTTPPAFLLAFALGLVPVVRGLMKRDRLAGFLIAWCLTPLVRYLLPQSTNFDGVRHFLEFFPPMAIIAGWGVAWFGQKLADRLHRQFPSARSTLIKVGLVAALSLPGAVAVLSVHPFHLTYWNLIAGGHAGAYQKALPQAGDYWGASYRLGLEWLNENAEADAYLVVPVVEHAVRLVAPERLRDDIMLLPVTTPFSPRIAPERLQKTLEAAARKPLYVMFIERRDWLNELMVDCLQRLEPEIVWQQEGAPVLYIFRYEPPQTPARTARPGITRGAGGPVGENVER